MRVTLEYPSITLILATSSPLHYLFVFSPYSFWKATTLVQDHCWPNTTSISYLSLMQMVTNSHGVDRPIDCGRRLDQEMGTVAAQVPMLTETGITSGEVRKEKLQFVLLLVSFQCYGDLIATFYHTVIVHTLSCK